MTKKNAEIKSIIVRTVGTTTLTINVFHGNEVCGVIILLHRYLLFWNRINSKKPVKKIYNYNLTIFVKQYISSEFYIQWIYFIHFILKAAEVQYNMKSELIDLIRNT